MHLIRNVLIGLGLFAPTVLLHESAADAEIAAPDLSAQLAAVEQTMPTPAADVPVSGQFYPASLANRGIFAPIFPPGMGMPAWNLGDGAWLVDDLEPVIPLRNGMRMMSPDGGPLPPGAGGGGEVTNTYTFNGVAFDTNRLWLEITNISGGTAYASLHHATNFVYAVKSAESLLTPPAGWNIETEVFPADTNGQPFTVATLGRDTLFLKAEDLTGVFTNGLPAWWSWLYFGNLSETATNRDALGISLGYDYTNGLDPNIVQFSLQFTNHYFNTSPAHGTITVAGGSPRYLAVMVNDTNAADAVWLPCTSTNVAVPLVDGDGIYQVQIGLRGLPADAQPTWLEAGLTLDTHPPVITLTNPVAGTVSTPMIQVQGLADETLGSLTFDVSNASGWFPDQAGYVIRQAYDTNQLKFTTNWIQCYDVALTNGVNVITLHATDLAGNTATTNVSCTLDYTGVSNAPALAVIWPPDGTRVAADQFTLQAQVDDATATVTATVNGHAVLGQIERSGQVWLPGLPLNNGTNIVTITAVNGAGNMSSTNLSVIGSAAGLTVAPLTGQLNQPTVTVTGTVADPGDHVTVNGVAGYVYDEAGDWVVPGVPVTPTGTADLSVELTDGAFNPLGEFKVGQPQPAMIALMSYQSFAHDTYVGVGEGDGHDDQFYRWDYQSGGRNWGDSFLENQGDDDHDYSYDYPIAAGLGALEGYVPSPVNKNIAAAGTFNNVLPYYSSFLGVYGPYSQQAQAQLMIVPSGQGLLGTTRLYLVGLSALAFSDPFTAQSIRQAGDVPVDPATLQVNGQPLTSSGLTNADGSMTGWALVAGPAGAPVPLTVTSSSAVNYSFKAQMFKSKEDWQLDVRNEIYADTGGAADMNTYNPANGFMNNRQNLQAVYAFYQKLFGENTNLLWAGLGKLAGAPVYGGLSDTEFSKSSSILMIPFTLLGLGTNDLTTFQNTLITMNTNILQDLAWQSEAYYKGGLQALNVIYAGEPSALDSDTINAWREIDDGISNNIPSEIQNGNLQLAHREQFTILQPIYNTLTGAVTNLMSALAKNPVPTGTNFVAIVPGGHLSVFADRWNWVTNSAGGIWPSWVAASPTAQSGWVNVPLTTRAANYATYPIY